jgi:hypothetical protein
LKWAARDGQISKSDLSSLLEERDPEMPVPQREHFVKLIFRALGGGKWHGSANDRRFNIQFNDFKAWAMADVSEQKRRELAVANWQLIATTAEGLRAELRQHMDEDNVEVADVRTLSLTHCARAACGWPAAERARALQSALRTAVR